VNFQDYTTYTIVDGAVRFSAAANVLTIANLDNDEAYYAYKDFGVGYFAADFESFFRIKFTLGTGAESVYVAAYANGIGDVAALVAGSGDVLSLAWTNGVLALSESNAGSVISATVTGLSIGTEYFIRLARDESVGTNGTLFLYVYTDRQLTELLASTSLALTEKQDFRYLYAASGLSTGAGSTALSGTISYLDLTPNPHTLKRLREDFKEIFNPPSEVNTVDTGLITAAEIKQWIIDAVIDISVRTCCDQDVDAVSTSAGQRFVAFSGSKPLFVEYSLLSLMQMRETQIGHEVTGGLTPNRFFVRGSNVGIEPLPDATYDLTLYVADTGGAEVSANYDIPLIPPAFRDIIFWNLMVRGFQKLRSTQLAATFYGIYMLEMKETMMMNVRPDIIEAYEDKRIPDVTLLSEE
jgi:hypothetical protein